MLTSPYVFHRFSAAQRRFFACAGIHGVILSQRPYDIQDGLKKFAKKA